MSTEKYQAAPEQIAVREAQVGGRILVTTLLDARSIEKRELDALYRRRWNVELGLVCIKATGCRRAGLPHRRDRRERVVGAIARIQPHPADGGAGRPATWVHATATELQTNRAAVQCMAPTCPAPRQADRHQLLVCDDRRREGRLSKRSVRAASVKTITRILPSAESATQRRSAPQSISPEPAGGEVSAIESMAHARFTVQS